MRFKNPSTKKPQVGDLVVFDAHGGNRFGHVAIVSQLIKIT